MHQIITQRQYIYSHYSFYEASDKLFFKLKGKQENFCMIDRKTNALYRFDRLFDNFQSIHINPFIGSEGGKLYVLARESELMEHYLLPCHKENNIVFLSRQERLDFTDYQY